MPQKTKTKIQKLCGGKLFQYIVFFHELLPDKLSVYFKIQLKHLIVKRFIASKPKVQVLQKAMRQQWLKCCANMEFFHLQNK